MFILRTVVFVQVRGKVDEPAYAVQHHSNPASGPSLLAAYDLLIGVSLSTGLM